MHKRLIVIGNELGIVIEKPILDLLDITEDTALELRTDGERLVIEPVRLPDHRRRIAAATKRASAEQGRLLKKLPD